ncbi:hypothetical protein [Hydromonas duriensis]|uniref:SWIM-type domain-containing protein n=1 Tax=Hydromonas duriensis TaxID=1527608 RepID=A0A4R6Y5I9_9BURK|nr:hypothetical protein [Hydromonas duriensis]TDR30688.1 hypothetical protein DFR44_11838 [Hydromonas duriensis]
MPRSLVKTLINEYAQHSKAEVEQRNNAKGILNPDEVAGDYDAALRQLTTTIDGQHRAITYEDLRRFKHKIAHIKGKLTKAGHKGGITARHVLSFSLPADRERAQDEIKTALPLRKDGNGLVVFSTNASAHSDVSHHLVHVRFLDFGSVLAARRVDDKLIKTLTSSRIKFDCDCGRHRFWFRFIASAGGFNEGRAESGFPKIRNPNLKGLACKHVLRVMTVVTQSPSFKAFIKQWIAAYRDDVSPQYKDQTNKDLKAFAQSFKQETWQQHRVAAKAIKTPATKSKKSDVQPTAKQLKPIAIQKKAEALGQRLSSQAKQKYIRDLQAALKIGAISQTTFDLAVKQYAQ